MKKLILGSIALLGSVLLLAGCGGSQAKNSQEKAIQKVKLGVVGENNEVWEDVKSRLKDDGIELEIVSFTDYSQPNAALADGEIDLNSFQHQIFLDNYNQEHGTDLVSIGNTVNAPLAVYSQKIKDLKELKKGDEIAIPNDVTNGARSLKLLQSADLLTLKETDNDLPTVADIEENPLNLKITELDAAQTARALPDVAASVINSGMAVDAGLIPDEDAIYVEPVNDDAKPYVNIIVSRKKDADNEVYQKIVDVYQQDATKQVIKETSKGASVPAWETFGRN